jgi:hypothetical protein
MMKMKLNKKIAGAAAMLMLSATMLGTSTFAWFTMNTEVTVTGLQTTAQAEEGIVIAAYTDNGTAAPVPAAFDKTAAAYNPLAAEKLYPTFTADAATWYHQTSTKSNDGQAYAETTAIAVQNDSTTDTYYYEVNKFQIKAAGTSTTSLPVYVKSVAVQSRTQTQAYDPSLRILVKSGSTVKIFAQDGAATSSGKSEFKLLDGSPSYTLTEANTSGASILTATTTPADVEIYMYYDGEDPACKSDNIDAFTQMTVNVKFGTALDTTP